MTETLEQGQLVIIKIDGPGYGNSTVTLDEWREADIIINDKFNIIKDTRTDHYKGMIPPEVKKQKATPEQMDQARIVKHAFDQDEDPELPIEDVTPED